MHDGISFEQLGKRAVVLCTEPFTVTVKNIARILGLPDYPFLKLQHPIGSCTLPELKARAEVAYRQALPILLEGLRQRCTPSSLSRLRERHRG